jgi:hypothetical protein
MLGACTLLVASTLAARASAQEAPPQVAVVRFDDEVTEAHVPTRLAGATDARTEPTDSGLLVAHLQPGAIVTRLASRGSAVLVEFDSPENPHKAIAGWVPMTSLLPPATAAPVPAATGGATVGPDGKALVMVHLDAPTRVTLERRRDGKWEEVCQAPCDVRLPLDGHYRTHGEGFRISRVFELEPVGGRVVLHVEPASSDLGAGVVVLGVGAAVAGTGVLAFVGAIFAYSGRDGGGAIGVAVAGLAAFGVGAVLCVVGAIVLTSRPPTKVRQPLAPTTGRNPTWSTGLERTQPGASFAIPLLSGTF